MEREYIFVQFINTLIPFRCKYVLKVLLNVSLYCNLIRYWFVFAEPETCAKDLAVGCVLSFSMQAMHIGQLRPEDTEALCRLVNGGSQYKSCQTF